MASLGKYTLIEQLGTGSMGTVYLARDTILDREIALKTIRTGADIEPEVKERFYREARTCARLQHPNIVTIFDLGEQDKFAYIAMELLAGSDFRKIIEGGSHVDFAVKIEAMIQVCEALAYAHQQGIVHRDVKPSNLFLSQDNRAKVLDFGIARLPSSRLTVVGRVLGTPNYMAPEQILGKRSDGRSDLFSIAVVFFELLVGQHPFQSALIPRRIVDGEPDSVFDHDSSAPLPFEKIFARGFAKDPDLRYATGDEFAADLRAVLDGLRQNSSPRFSKFALPSLRAPVAAKPSAAPIFNPFDSRDREEWQLSEFLRVLPMFESAVERGDRSSAEETLIRLRSISDEDMRFTESLRICADKVLKMSPVPPDLPPFSAGPSVTEQLPTAADNSLVGDPIQGDSFTQWLRSAISATQTESMPSDLPAEPVIRDHHDAICQGCGGRNRREASFCISCGGRMPSPEASIPTVAPTIPVKKPKASKDSDQPSPSLGRVTAAYAVLIVWTIAQGRTMWRKLSASTLGVLRLNPKVLAGAGIVVGLVVVAIWYLTQTRVVPIEPWVATGVIQAQGTPLLRVINGPGTRIASLAAGTRVDLLKQPGFDGQWLLVQPIVREKALAHGYVKRDAVSKWNSANADVALALARHPGPFQKGDADLQKQINDLQGIVTRFPGTTQARAAAIEEAGFLLELSKRDMSGGQPDAEWRTRAQQARSLVEGLLPDPQAVAVVRDVGMILAPPAAGPGPSPAPDPADLADLAKARELFSSYDYDGVIRILNIYLMRHPGDRYALGLRSTAQNAKRLENGTLP